LAGSAFKDAATVAKVKASFTPILVDGDDPANADFDDTYGLRYYPSVVFTDMDGKAVETLNGASPDAFKAAVDRLAR
jgi:hypothetical protein